MHFRVVLLAGRLLVGSAPLTPSRIPPTSKAAEARPRSASRARSRGRGPECAAGGGFRGAVGSPGAMVGTVGTRSEGSVLTVLDILVVGPGVIPPQVHRPSPRRVSQVPPQHSVDLQHHSFGDRKDACSRDHYLRAIHQPHHMGLLID